MNDKQTNRYLKILCLTLFAGFGLCVSAQTADTTRQIASMKADLQVCDENIRKLVAAVEIVQQSNTALRGRLNAVEKKLRAVSNDVEALHSALEAEKSARTTAINNLLNKLSKDMNILIKEIEERPAATAGGYSGPSQGSYTVKSGDTLSVIAKAFNVSVGSLKSANGLTSDLIREGQTLNIPSQER